MKTRKTAEAKPKNEAAETNELLASRAPDLSKDDVKESLDANNPAGSHAAYRDGKND